jgi:hypothetical protein
LVVGLGIQISTPPLVVIVDVHEGHTIESGVAGDAAVGLTVIDAFESVDEREKFFEVGDKVAFVVSGEAGWRLADPFALALGVTLPALDAGDGLAAFLLVPQRELFGEEGAHAVVGVDGVDHLVEEMDGGVGVDGDIDEVGGQGGPAGEPADLNHDDVVVAVVANGLKEFAEGFAGIVSSRPGRVNVLVPVSDVVIGKPFEDRPALALCAGNLFCRRGMDVGGVAGPFSGWSRLPAPS